MCRRIGFLIPSDIAMAYGLFDLRSDGQNHKPLTDRHYYLYFTALTG